MKTLKKVSLLKSIALLSLLTFTAQASQTESNIASSALTLKTEQSKIDKAIHVTKSVCRSFPMCRRA